MEQKNIWKDVQARKYLNDSGLSQVDKERKEITT